MAGKKTAKTTRTKSVDTVVANPKCVEAIVTLASDLQGIAFPVGCGKGILERRVKMVLRIRTYAENVKKQLAHSGKRIALAVTKRAKLEKRVTDVKEKLVAMELALSKS